MEKVILVNKKDIAVGAGEKMKAHQKGKLHRAFSIILFDKKGEILIQKRAKSKYHSPGLWTNTCCSHPKPGENLKEAAAKRLKEEMGISCDLKKAFSFIYRAKLGSLTEHELDHVFLGRFNGEPRPNKKEVDKWEWIKPVDLESDIKESPQKYTPWFKIIFEKIKKRKTWCQK